MLQRTSIEHTVATSNTQRPHRTHSGSMKHMMASCIGHIAVALDAHTSVGGEGLAEIRQCELVSTCTWCTRERMLTCSDSTASDLLTLDRIVPPDDNKQPESRRGHCARASSNCLGARNVGIAVTAVWRSATQKVRCVASSSDLFPSLVHSPVVRRRHATGRATPLPTSASDVFSHRSVVPLFRSQPPHFSEFSVCSLARASVAVCRANGGQCDPRRTRTWLERVSAVAATVAV